MDISLVFKLYYKPLCLYATHYLGDIARAEDVVQDCFVKLIEAQRKATPTITQPRQYLYVAVRNQCLNALRADNDAVNIPCPTDLEGGITDDEAIEASTKEAKLWTAVDQLPDKRREVLLMSKRDGMKYSEIARQLGISEKTVEHHISKALKTLRGKAEDFFYFLMGMA